MRSLKNDSNYIAAQNINRMMQLMLKTLILMEPDTLNNQIQGKPYKINLVQASSLLFGFNFKPL